MFKMRVNELTKVGEFTQEIKNCMLPTKRDVIGKNYRITIRNY